MLLAGLVPWGVAGGGVRDADRPVGSALDLDVPAQHAFRDWPPVALRERPYWLPWSREVFQRATLFGEPVFFLLTVNWNRAAQQLEQATLADRDVLRLINSRYVSLKVNADLRPDIRERYQTGVWPAVAFLLPNGKTDAEPGRGPVGGPPHNHDGGGSRSHAVHAARRRGLLGRVDGPAAAGG